jgi:outer membrane protein assembly factor BamB
VGDQKQIVKMIIGVTGISLLLVLLFAMLQLSFAIIDLWPYWRVSYRVTKNSGTTLEELWSQSNFFVASGRPCPLIAAAGGKLFFSGDFKWPPSGAIYALDEANGSLLWRKNGYGGVNSFSCFRATPTGLYVGSNGNGRITKYDIDTGEIFWSERIPGARSAGSFRIDDQLIYSVSSNGRHFLRADTGEILQTVTTATLTPTILQEIANQMDFTSTNQIRPELFKTSIFTKDVVIHHQGGGRVNAENRQTEELLWERNDVASNVAVTESAVYLLTSNYQLLKLDLQTGKIIAFVQFEQNSSGTVDSGNSYANTNNVILDEDTDILYITLGAGAQLFAFKIAE